MEFNRFVTTLKPIAWVKEGECIRCTSHAHRRGYPRITRNKKIVSIARAILQRKLGDLSDDIVSRHTCDNKWCINPHHIISGTQLDNIKDRVIRGRNGAARGEKNGTSKLTKQEVLKIRKLYKQDNLSTKEIAARFGVCCQTIRNIKTGLFWKSV